MEHMNTQMSDNNPQQSSEPVDFRKLACDHIARGFIVSATQPASKKGVWKWNGINLCYSVQDVDRFLERNPKFKHANVAVIGGIGTRPKLKDGKIVRDAGGRKITEGNIFILDIDRAGVTKQIVEETGKKLPQTYVVRSRPQSNPAKVHIYFRHTPYSIAAFTQIAQRYGKKATKEISGIRDRSLPMDERGYYPNRYDVKGSGKNGYVLGAGSVHSTEEGGEVYTAINENPVLNVPDWMVDWIVADCSKEFDAREADTAARREHAKKVIALDPGKRTRLQRQNNPAGFIISKASTYLFLLFKARFFATQGPSRRALKAFLIDRAIDACHDGKAFVESEVGKRAIEHILDKTEIDSNEPWLQRQDLDDAEETCIHSLTVINSLHTSLTKIVKTFPDEISAEDVYALLGLDKKSKADREQVRRAMGPEGFIAENIGGQWTWKRSTPHDHAT